MSVFGELAGFRDTLTAAVEKVETLGAQSLPESLKARMELIQEAEDLREVQHQSRLTAIHANLEQLELTIETVEKRRNAAASAAHRLEKAKGNGAVEAEQLDPLTEAYRRMPRS